VIIKFCLVFPKIFLLHKVVRDAKKVEKHWPTQLNSPLAGCESEQSVWSAKPTSITQVYEMGASNNAQVN